MKCVKRVGSTLLFFEVTNSIKSRIFLKICGNLPSFMNTSLYSWNESTRKKVASVVTSNYGGFYCVTYFELFWWYLSTKFLNRIPLLRAQVLPKRKNHHGISTSKAYRTLTYFGGTKITAARRPRPTLTYFGGY
jgi:hypothetical protein